MKLKIGHYAVGLLFTTLIFAGTTYYFHSINQDQISENSRLERQINKKESEKELIQEHLDTLTDRYQELYSQKEGTAKTKLITATRTMFDAVYNYDTGTSKDTVANRKKAVQKVADDKAVEVLFPSNAQNTTPSVNLTSKMEGDPSIYLKSSDSNELEAVVKIDYKVTIKDDQSDDPDQTGSGLYLVTYDQFRNKFTSIKNLGDINVD